MQIHKWLYPGMKVKRWFLLACLGLVLTIIGFAITINFGILSKTEELVMNALKKISMSRGWVDLLIYGIIVMVIGIALIIFGIRQVMRSLIAAVAPGTQDKLVDIVHKKLKEVKVQNTQAKDFHVDEISEFQTRKQYIDIDLKDAGWVFREDCIEEFELQGMPFGSGTGYADYVLLGDNGKPLAVIEAKRASVSPEKGKHQATLYADCLEKRFGQRPIIFYTNGFKTYIWDDTFYPERLVSGFYSKEELQLRVDRRVNRLPLNNIKINDAITNRYYQKEAVKAVCETFSRSAREALLVMATGSGKTRTAISIVDVLTRYEWIKNILFLTDRTALVKQAKNNFNTLLPSLSLCNLIDSRDNPESRMVFSTYPTIMNAIDETKLEDGKKLFTVGHFDLIIIDEAHRSIFKKYQAIFNYFDSLLLGLTATPKDDVDRNTYTIFNMENNVPTYAYELEEAVKDGYLVPYNTVETTLKFLEEGIHYDELSEEEKEEYEATFGDEEEFPEFISNDSLNTWLFNDDTIEKVLTLVMDKGIKVEGGDKLGKTIIFAKNHNHAVRIVDRFNKLYPHYKGGFTQVIDNQVSYAQDLIDKFSAADKMPQIAVSVDMLDTGIDVPEVVNLVFFKKVRSKAKFWQMIGRGTRLCPNLFGPGLDKENFLIFDFCGNFEFFRVSPRGTEGKNPVGLTERIFNTRLELIKELQHIDYQEEEYQRYREVLVDELTKKIKSLNKDNFVVKQKLWYIEKYSKKQQWQNLTAIDLDDIKKNIAPLILPDNEDEMAKRFDSLILTLELAIVLGKSITKGKNEVIKTAVLLAELGTIPQVQEKKEIIERVQTEEFWSGINLLNLEQVREDLRELIKFIQGDKKSIYYTDFTDEILLIHENPPEYGGNELQNYRKKVNQYLRENQNHLAIHKLRTNKPLTKEDFLSLEKILWNEIGTKEDYQREFGDTPLTILVRQIVGLDQGAANEAFSEFLDDQNLNSKQIRFVKTIIDYVIKKETIVDTYLRNIRSVNNWDLVDSSADKILGAFLFDKDKSILYDFARSSNLWEQRIAIISTFYFIKQNHFDDTLKIAKILLNHNHDLIHKGVGWMLREIGNRDSHVEFNFLRDNYKVMPRTMLRYAIEKFEPRCFRHYVPHITRCPI
jgi:type I restriction enzyme R subunit